MSKHPNRKRKDRREPRASARNAAHEQQIEAALRSSYEALQRGHYQKAEQVLRKALERHPRERRLMANLVAALDNQGSHEGAERVAEAAAAAYPDDPKTHNNLGAILKFQGRLDEARAEFRRAVELAPDYASAWRNLAGLESYSDPEHPDLAAMRALLPKVPRDDDGRTSLYFALANAYDQIGDVDEAFTYYERGNRHRRARVRYSLPEMKRLVDETIAHQSAELVGRGPAAGAVEDAPVLVVGMPRSGSTLVEQVLASHSDVRGVGEVPDLPRALEPHVSDPRDRVRTVAALDDAAVASIGRAYARSLTARAPEGARVTDKYLTNFVHLGFLRRALPNARFVHVRRAPMDNGFGCFRTHFTSSIPYAYDFEGIAGTYAETHRLMAHWREVAPEALVEVDYEAFVADLEGETRRLLDVLGLPWDDRCLRFHETERRVNSASSTQVRMPLYDSSVGRWRPYAKHLRPLASAFESFGVDAGFDAGAGR